MLYTAANENFLNIEEVTKRPAVEFLNFMNFYKKKSELENERIKNAHK